MPRIPLGDWVNSTVDWLLDNVSWLFTFLKDIFTGAYDASTPSSRPPSRCCSPASSP